MLLYSSSLYVRYCTPWSLLYAVNTQYSKH